MSNTSGGSQWAACLALGALAAFAGCSSDATTRGGSPTATSVVFGPETTTPATPTTVVVPLTLRDDGLGPFDFGSASTAVIEAITAQHGAPARNDLLLYEDDSQVAEGYYESLVPPHFYALAYPVGRTTCWTGDFCAEFGGADEASLIFIGWQYSGPPHMFASAPNLTITADWEEFPSMVVNATCYTTGGGTHHGIKMVLEVDGGWDWLVPDGGGGFVENLPDPAITRVTSLNAGQLPFQAGLDC